MAVQPTREDARDTGTLNQYAHLYDVERLRQDIGTGEHGTASDGDKFGVVKGSDSITVEDGVAKVNPDIFGDGIKVEDGQVTFDQDKLPLASTANRGTVKVGSGLAIDAEGVLSATGSNSLPITPTVTARVGTKRFAVTDSPTDVKTSQTVMPVYDVGGFYSVFGGYFYVNTTAAYTTGTKIHIELDVVLQEKHICSSNHRVAVVAIGNTSYTIPFFPSRYNDWYYWSFDVPVTSDVAANTQVYVNVF